MRQQVTILEMITAIRYSLDECMKEVSRSLPCTVCMYMYINREKAGPTIGTCLVLCHAPYVYLIYVTISNVALGHVAHCRGQGSRVLSLAHCKG